MKKEKNCEADENSLHVDITSLNGLGKSRYLTFPKPIRRRIFKPVA